MVYSCSSGLLLCLPTFSYFCQMITFLLQNMQHQARSHLGTRNAGKAKAKAIQKPSLRRDHSYPASFPTSAMCLGSCLDSFVPLQHSKVLPNPQSLGKAPLKALDHTSYKGFRRGSLSTWNAFSFGRKCLTRFIAMVLTSLAKHMFCIRRTLVLV